MGETQTKPTEAIVSEDVKNEEQDAPKGSLTPENRQYAAFLEERDRRRDAEKRVQKLERKIERLTTPEENPQAAQPFNGQHSEEGLVLKKEIERLENELLHLKGNTEMTSVTAKFPQLSAHADEFDEFRRDYPGVSAEKVAKLFLMEKGALPTAQAQERPGLESPTGGSREPAKQGFSLEELKKLREDEPRKYQKMIQTGKIDITKLSFK
jgi:hypothetical protein